MVMPQDELRTLTLEWTHKVLAKACPNPCKVPTAWGEVVLQWDLDRSIVMIAAASEDPGHGTKPRQLFGGAATIPDTELSPESLTEERWKQRLQSMGWGAIPYAQRLVETNGSSEPHRDGSNIVWGLRHNESGRWMGNKDMDGNECLQVFRHRTHAAKACNSDLSAVWMNVRDFWKKVMDSAQTGYPRNVNLLIGFEDGRTQEASISCKDAASSPLQILGFMALLAHGELVENERSTGELIAMAANAAAVAEEDVGQFPAKSPNPAEPDQNIEPPNED